MRCSRLLDIYTNSGDRNGAGYILNIVMETIEDPRKPMFSFKAWSLGFYQLAEQFLSHSENPDDHLHLDNICVVKYNSGKFEGCEEIVNKSLRLNGQSCFTHFIKSFIDMRNRKMESSLREIDTCLAKKQNDSFYHLKRAFVLGFYESVQT